jgi:hypothetical protein
MAITADDMNADRFVANPGAMDKLNRAVIEEFRAHQGKVGGRNDVSFTMKHVNCIPTRC